jgi:predicted metal-dependent hydrolase
MLTGALLAAGAVLAYKTMRGPRNLVDVRSVTDGRTYRMQDLPDKQEACELMARLHANLVRMIEHCRQEQNEPYQRLVTRFNPDNFEENDMQSDSTSYSENKGEKIVVCLRDKAQPPTYPLIEDNTIMFVLLHEMAHLMTASTGHTPEFWTNFRILLQDCVKLGIYTSVNYARFPTAYCGMTITDTPL